MEKISLESQDINNKGKLRGFTIGTYEKKRGGEKVGAFIYVLKFLFYTSAFCIVWSMAGYAISLKLIYKIKKPVEIHKCNHQDYTVTVMITAHNEEKVIKSKLENVTNNDYPKDKIDYLVASDNSTDRTNEIVQEFIESHKDLKVRLYCTKEHKGKTNAQNEAHRLVSSDILVMTDADTILHENAISELVSSFSEEDIAYVCGALCYTNTENTTAASESCYQGGEMKTRMIESRIRTITAGNGAIYACRNRDYIEIPPIESHDSSMPYYYGMIGKRAILNEKVIAYVKAGETSKDEYKRKVRMNRVIFLHLKRGIKAFNIFKHGWFSYFFFGHRTARYLLWLNHLLVFLSSLILAFLAKGFWIAILGGQVVFYLLACMGKSANNKLIHLIFYYCMTVVAQWNGVFRVITGKAKPTWDSPSTAR